MVKLRIESDNNFKEDDIIKKVGYTINWVEAYSEEITINLSFYLKLNRIINNLFEQINDIINKKQIKYEQSKRNPQHTSIVNSAIFYGIESILRVVTSNDNIDLPLISRNSICVILLLSFSNGCKPKTSIFSMRSAVFSYIFASCNAFKKLAMRFCATQNSS